MTLSNHFDRISKLLIEKETIILDGALATELEARGCDLDDALWSAKILHQQPGRIQEVHKDYFRAGADVAITASYQASLPGFKTAGFDELTARHLISQSVVLARQAREQVLAEQPRRQMLVAGSVGPYGAFLANGSEYRGDYHVSESALKDFHKPRIEALLDGGADLLAFETLPSASEALALLDLLHGYPKSVKAWFSFTLHDSARLSDGTDLADIMPKLNASDQVIAVGANCVPPGLISPMLSYLTSLTTKALIAYPNSGEDWDADSNTWSGKAHGGHPVTCMSLMREWQGKGARLIGGCCRTGPAEISMLSRSVDHIVD